MERLAVPLHGRGIDISRKPMYELVAAGELARVARWFMEIGVATAALTAGAGNAQTVSASEAERRRTSGPEEIIVTARKREESILDVPVVANVITAETLERNQVVDLKDIARLAPAVQLGDSILAIGTQVSIRGVGTSTLDPGVDQSISLVLDGLSLGQGLAYTSGTFDLAQAEILKGPQSLFFGKGSPGGVISLRTADPGNLLEVIGRAGYELEAHTRRGELIVSGPVTQTLGIRLAGMYEKSDGFFYNKATAAPGTGAKDPSSSRLNGSNSYVVRGTALWRPSYAVDVRVKANLVRDKVLRGGVVQLTNCPDGTNAYPGIPGLLQPLPFINPNDDCKADRTAYMVDFDPAYFPGIPNSGVPFNELKQRFGTVEVNLRPTDAITLTSVTGYYWNRSDGLYNISNAAAAGPIYTFQNRYRRREITQEVRLSSDYAGPLNFTLGSFLQDGKVRNRVTLIANRAYAIFGLPDQDLQHNMKISSASAFGQLRFKPVEQVEIAAGGRYIDESRRDDPVFFLPGGAVVPITLPTPRISARTFSPEVTVSYEPTDDLTIFGALKKGYKSGSFNLSPIAPGEEKSFGDESVKGGEAGIKSRLLDRRMTLNLSGYYYKYSGLQVGVNQKVEGGGSAQISRTLNAGKARVYGAELEMSYAPPQVDGLQLNAAVAYTNGKFTDLQNVPCAGGQFVSEGCDQLYDPATGLYSAQDLSGIPLVRAPKWQGSFGLNYELPVTSSWSLVLSNDNQFSSRYLANLGTRPDHYQDGYFRFDLGATVKSTDRRWEIALLGKNVGNVIRSGTCPSSNYEYGLLGGQVTGGTVRGPAGVDEGGCIFDRGRSVWVRLTLRPFG